MLTRLVLMFGFSLLLMTRAGASEIYLSEEFCDIGGLPKATRHTYLLVDESRLVKTDSRESFSVANEKILTELRSFVIPGSAIKSGHVGIRERLFFYGLPASGAPAVLKFTGCMPGLTEEERHFLEANRSGLNKIFKTSPARQLEDAQKAFVQDFIRALFELTAEASDHDATGVDDFLNHPAMRSLSATNRLIEPHEGVSRVVMFLGLSELGNTIEHTAEFTRNKGFEDGESVTFDYARSDVVVIHDHPNPEFLRSYAEAFVLSQQGNLTHWGDQRINRLAEMPKEIQRYEGEVTYPDGPQPIRIRLALDSSDRLVHSWATVRDFEDLSVPMSGLQVCQEANCTLKNGDPTYSFTGLWNREKGESPDPTLERIVPFAGLREFELQISENTLSGKIFDSAVGEIRGELKDDENETASLEYLSVRADKLPAARF